MTTSVIVGGARTPMGTLLGGLSTLSATELGGIAIRAAVERSGISADAVQYLIMGHALPAAAGQGPARQAGIAGGLPWTVPSTGVAKVCLSGVQSVIIADQFIRAGDLEVTVAGGMESMSRAPHMLPASRRGTKYGTITMADHMEVDGLRDAFDGVAMGLLTEQRNDLEDERVSREEQDAFAVASHQRAAAGWDAGIFDDEVVPVTVPQRRGDPIIVTRDEGVRPSTSTEVLGRLPGAFRAGGTITAGNASPISDGASAVVVMSRERAEREGLPWLAEVGAHGMVAGPDQSLQFQPANAIALACAKEKIEPSELDLVEINEAFAAVGIASARRLGVPLDRVNVHGGAIAIGHPLGMSGNRLVLHMALELRRRGGGVGAVALCGGGGQGDALILRVPKV